MNWRLPLVFSLAMLLAFGACRASAQEDTKLLDRIKVLEGELARLSRELQDLRAKAARNAEPKVDSIVQALDRAYESLLAKTLDKELLVKAATSFQRGNPEGALELLRRGRHLAAIPLILKDLVQRESRGKPKKDDIARHLFTLAILTGEDIETLASTLGSCHRLASSWWLADQGRTVADLGKMSPSQLAHVARRLRHSVEPVEAYKSNGPSYYANALLYRIVNHRDDSPDRRGPSGWYAEELHPALGPVFLSALGFRPEGAHGEDIVEVPYQIVHLLAAMRRNGALPMLEKIAVDPKQNTGLRLVGLLTLNSAGEGVNVPAVLSILASEKKLDRKLAALEFLYYADDLEPAADYLLEALDDPNLEVRRSVLNALRKSPPARLLRKLRELADTKHQEQVLEVIAVVRTTEAQQYLADYLAKTMNDRPKTERIHDVLWAFQHSVDQHWISAGRYSFDHYHNLATKALKWWKENGEQGK